MTETASDVEQAPSQLDILDRSRPTAVIFDLDGTLIDSESVAFECVNLAIQTLWAVYASRPDGGIPEGTPAPEVSAELHSTTIGKEREVWASEVIDILKLPFTVEELTSQWLKEIGPRYKCYPLMEGAAELITFFAEQRLPMAIGTSSERHRGQAKVAGHPKDIERHMDVIVTRNDAELGKPEPDIFLEAARQLGKDAATCLIFEDSPAGIKAAHASGATVVAVVDRRFNDGCHPWNDLAHITVSDLQEAKELMQTLFQGKWSKAAAAVRQS